MQIRDVARISGFSKDTIRWYEKIGLIELDQQSRNSNNYRVYDQATLDRLIHIRQLKAFGFTLKEVETLLLLQEVGSVNCLSVLEIVEPKLELIDQKIEQLKALKSRLIKTKEDCTGNCMEMLTSKN